MSIAELIQDKIERAINKDVIMSAIYRAIEGYDFEPVVESCIEGIVESKVESYIEYQIDGIIDETVGGTVEDVLDEVFS